MLKAKLASLEMELEECRDAAENGLRCGGLNLNL